MVRRLARAGAIVVAALALVSCRGSQESTILATISGPPPCVRSTATPTVTITMKDTKFGTDPVKAKVGDVIGWTNADDVPHTATLDDGSCGTDQLAKGATQALVFSKPGSYPYKCLVHPAQMTGTIEISG